MRKETYSDARGPRSDSRAYFSPESGETNNYAYAVKIDGLKNDSVRTPNSDTFSAIGRFKDSAKSDWISAKARKGKRPMAEVKRWIKSVNPSQFYARWPTNVDEDSFQIWYTGGNLEA